jgi:D-3-phosphoglycerate dehydrogenase
LVVLVNEILADHNVDKQMTDSRGEVAYLMADISNVNQGEIKDLWQNLEDLSCKLASDSPLSLFLVKLDPND